MKTESEQQGEIDWRNAYANLEDELEQVLLAVATQMETDDGGIASVQLSEIRALRVNDRTVKFTAVCSGPACRFSFRIERNGCPVSTSSSDYCNSQTIGNLEPGRYQAHVTAAAIDGSSRTTMSSAVLEVKTP